MLYVCVDWLVIKKEMVGSKIGIDLLWLSVCSKYGRKSDVDCSEECLRYVCLLRT